MTYAWIICGGLGIVAGWCFACFRYYKKKWEDAVAKKEDVKNGLMAAVATVGRLKRRNDEVSKENEENKALAKKMMQDCRDLCDLCNAGWTNLQTRVFGNRIEVVGVYGKNLWFTIKPFHFDNEEDKEFAIREAEELIETIQKF